MGRRKDANIKSHDIDHFKDRKKGVITPISQLSKWEDGKASRKSTDGKTVQAFLRGNQIRRLQTSATGGERDAVWLLLYIRGLENMIGQNSSSRGAQLW